MSTTGPPQVRARILMMIASFAVSATVALGQCSTSERWVLPATVPNSCAEADVVSKNINVRKTAIDTSELNLALLLEHELGHMLGLANAGSDLSCTAGNEIMNGVSSLVDCLDTNDSNPAPIQ